MATPAHHAEPPRTAAPALDAVPAYAAEPPRMAAPARDAVPAYAAEPPPHVELPRISEPSYAAEPPPEVELPRMAEPSRHAAPAYSAEPPPDVELPRMAEPSRHAEPPRMAAPAYSAEAPRSTPVAPSGPVMDGLPPSAARPLSILRNGGGAMPPPAPAYSATNLAPSGPVMDGLSPSAARPLSFLRNGGSAAPAPVEPPAPPRVPAGATPLSRTTEPAPAVRITNVRKPEPPPGPPEPPPEADDDARYYPEPNSPEGCASGECLPEAAAPAPVPAPVAAEPDPEPEPTAPAPVISGGRDNPNLPLIERWRAAVESVKATSPRHGAALANGRLVSMRAGEIVLGFLPTAGFHRTAVASPGGKATIDKALAEHFGRAVKLTVTEVSPEDARIGPSIAEQDAQSRAAHEKSTEGKVRNHPSVRAVLKLLGGEIEHIQVYEPERPSAVPAGDTPDDSA